MLCEQETKANTERADRLAIRVEIERTHWTATGARYRVTSSGGVLIESARDPEHEACRALLAKGITGTLVTFHPGGKVARMRLDIARGAGLTVTEGATQGPRTTRWKPFGSESEEGEPE